MMDYSSTDEATTSEDDENSVERQQNLVARVCNFQEKQEKAAMLMQKWIYNLSRVKRKTACDIRVTFSPCSKDADDISHWRCTKYSKDAK
uniref:Uncharacterized protein n=1 Tax=Ditylenchus dipsaci TaxID=166011 RepID=A0A915D8Y3_9BILA